MKGVPHKKENPKHFAHHRRTDQHHPVVIARGFAHNALEEINLANAEYSKYDITDEVILDDGTRIECKTTDPERAMFYTVHTHDGKISYQYYDAVADMFYSISSYAKLDKVNANRASIIEKEPVVTDVAELRRRSTEVVYITNAEERIIRKALKDADRDIRLSKQSLTAAGLTNISITSDALGNIYVEKQSSKMTARAGATFVNPAKQTAKQYAPMYSNEVKATRSTYHSGLQRTISTKVMQSRDDYVQKNAVKVVVEAGIGFALAATACKTGQPWFASVLSAYSVATSLNTLREAISFMSEVYWTYNAEKGGWVYDYVTPNAVGRRNGYVCAAPNSQLGKITLGWDGSGTTRTNFRWSQTVNVTVYDTPNATLLDKAYRLYTAKIVVDGYY